MKKRIVTLIGVLCLLLALPFVFSACVSTEPHTHEFAGEWTGDDTHHWHAAVCEHSNEVADRAEHTWDTRTVLTEPTETEAGSMQYTCTVCGATKTEPIAAVGHTHAWVEDGVTAPTCTENGYTAYICSCGHTKQENITQALGHQYTDCDENGDGTHTFFCQREQKDVTEACVYTESVTAPLCTEQGYTTYTCDCGYSYRDNYTAALGHSHNTNVLFNDVYHWYEATCEHNTERLEYKAHTFKTDVTAPTCTAQGYTTYTCDCGYSYRGSIVEETGHSVSAWVEGESTLFDASCCKSAVIYSGECGTCHETMTKTEYVEKHSFYWAVTTPATCSAEGTKHKLCNNEGCNFHVAGDHCETEKYSDSEAHLWVVDPINSSTAVTVHKCELHNSVTKKTMNIVDSTVENVNGSDLKDVNELEFPDAILGFDDGIKDMLNGKTDISISAGKLDDTAKEQAINGANLSEEDRALLGDNPIYNFVITSGTEIDQLGGTATVRVPYTLTPGQNPDQIVVWYIADGELEAVKATYGNDAQGNGFITFTTTHFSCYVPAELSPWLYCKIYGHSDETFTVPPTCTEQGYTICLHCGAQIATVAPTGHNMHSAVSQAPTCDANGIMHFSCDGCDLAYNTAIPATGHYHVLHSHTGATCKAAGSNTFRCVYCEDSYSITIPQLNHNHVSTVIAPTCTEGGYTLKVCGQCGDTLTVNRTSPLAHTYATAWSKSEEGHYHICTVCGARDTLHAHIPGAEATEQSAQICTACEYVITPPIAHVHSLTEVKATAPDCTHGGNLAYYTCQCGKWFLDANAQQLIVDHTSIYLLALGHSPVSMDPVAPDCDTVGYTAGVQCSVCEEILKGHNEIAKLGHRYTAVVTAPTCTEGGYTVFTCTCGDTYTGEQTPALDHNYLSVVTAPTCTEDGYTTHTCTRCAHSYVDAETSALNHTPSMTLSFDEHGHWIACTRCKVKLTEGEHTPDYEEATVEHGITCTLCGYVIEDVLPHTHAPAKTVEGKAPTCTASGVKTYYVCACGTWFEDAECQKPITDFATLILPANGHTPKDVAATESTCQAHGYTAGTICEICDKWLSGHEELPLAGHDYNDNGICPDCGAKTALYTYTESGADYTLLYEFFGDFTVRGYMEYIGENDSVEPIEDFAEWILNDKGLIVIIYEGEEEQRFFIGEDGETLTPVEIVYSYSDRIADGYIYYYFYSDAVFEAVIETEETNTICGTWVEEDGKILVTVDGETEALFTVDEEGNLSPIIPEPPVEDRFVYLYEEKNDQFGIYIRYEFYADGTMMGTVEAAGQTTTLEGEWILDGEEILLYYEGTPVVRFSVSEDRKTLIAEKSILYFFAFEENGETVSFEFYSDGTMLIIEKDGDYTAKMEGTWREENSTIFVTIENETMPLFTVNEDGSLSIYEGETKKEIAYRFDEMIDGGRFLFEFYTDGTAYICVTSPAGETMEYTDATWALNGDKLDITLDGYTDTYFTVDENGNLSIYEGEPDPSEVLYTFEYYDGAEYGIYEFFANGSVRATVTYEDGEVYVDWADWIWINGNTIAILVEGEEVVRFAVDENGNLTIKDGDDPADKKLVYTFTEKDADCYLLYEFYSDHSVRGYAEFYTEDGKVQTFEAFGNWHYEGAFIVLTAEEGDVEERFVVNDDFKTLSRYEYDDENIEALANERYEQLKKEWEMFRNETNIDAILGADSFYYKKITVILEDIPNAPTREELEAWTEEFYHALDQARQQMEGTVPPVEPPVELKVRYTADIVYNGVRYSFKLYPDYSYSGTKYEADMAMVTKGTWTERDDGTLQVRFATDLFIFAVNDDQRTLSLVEVISDGYGPTTPIVPPTDKEIYSYYAGNWNGQNLAFTLYTDGSYKASVEQNGLSQIVIGKWAMQADGRFSITVSNYTYHFQYDEASKMLILLAVTQESVEPDNEIEFECHETINGVTYDFVLYQNGSVDGYISSEMGGNSGFSGDWLDLNGARTELAVDSPIGRFVFTVNEDGYTLSIKEIPAERETVYTYGSTENGKHYTYSFYSDGTGMFTYEGHNDDGGWVEGRMSFDWYEEKGLITVSNDGMALITFTVTEDGKLTPNNESQGPNPPITDYKPLYTFEMNDSDNYMLILFYDGHSAYVYSYLLGGMEIELEAEWVFISEDTIVLILFGEEQMRFTVCEDGSLQPEGSSGPDEEDIKELANERYKMLREEWIMFRNETGFDIYFDPSSFYYKKITLILDEIPMASTRQQLEELTHEFYQTLDYAREEIESMNPGGDVSLDELIAQTLRNMKDEWHSLYKYPAFTEMGLEQKYQSQFDSIYENIQNATSEDMLNRYYKQFDSMINSIMSQIEIPVDCPHETLCSGSVPPTCTTSGYSQTFCANCGHIVWEETIPALGHSFDDSGFCPNCGQFEDGDSNDELEAFIEETLNFMDETWNYYLSYTDVKLLPDFAAYEKNVFNMERLIKAATSVDEVKHRRETFDDLMHRIDMELQNSGDEPALEILYSYDTPNLRVTFYFNHTAEVIFTEYAADGSSMEAHYTVPWSYGPEAVTMLLSVNGSTYTFRAFENGEVILETVENDPEGDESIDELINELLHYMDIEWNNLYKHPAFKELGLDQQYQKQYTSYREKVKSVTTEDEINIYYDKFHNMINKIMDQIKAAETDPVDCPHTNTQPQTFAPTCTQPGYDRGICADCGVVVWNNLLPALGHSFDDSGFCPNCGTSEGDDSAMLQELIEETLQKMDVEWKNLYSYSGFASVEKAYRSQFDSIYNQIQNAINESMVNHYYQSFERMLAKIKDQLGASGEQPVEKEIRYLFDETIEGIHVRYEFYTDGTIRVHLWDDAGNNEEDWAEWHFDGMYVNVVYNGEIVQQFTVNGDDFTLSPVEGEQPDVCPHSQTYSEIREPTCTQPGYDRGFCADCGVVVWNNLLPALGHSFDDSGFCPNCGTSEGDDAAMLQELIEKTLKSMDAKWNSLYRYVAFTEMRLDQKYQTQFASYYDRVMNAATETMLNNHYERFQTLIDKIMDEIHQFGGEIIDPVEKEVLYTYDNINLRVIFYSDNTADVTVIEYATDGTSMEFYYTGAPWWNQNPDTFSLVCEVNGKTYYFGTDIYGNLVLDSVTDNSDLQAQIQNKLDSMTFEWKKLSTYPEFMEMGLEGAYFKQFESIYYSIQNATNEAMLNRYYVQFENMLAEIMEKMNIGGGEEYPTDIEMLRKEVLVWMGNVWNDLHSNPYLQKLEAYEYYRNSFDAYYLAIEGAVDAYEIEQYRMELEQLFREIKEKLDYAGISCSHGNVTHELIEEGTCTMPARYECVCLDCGETWGEFGEYAPHELDERGCCRNCDHCAHINMDLKDTVEATCTSTGERVASCGVCGFKVVEQSLRLNHHIGSDGACTYCGQFGKKTIHEYMLWNNTGSAYQRYYFYEDLTGYAFQTIDNGSGFWAVEGEINFTWNTDGKELVTVYMDGNKVGSFRILADGSLEPIYEQDDPNQGGEVVPPDVPVTPDDPIEKPKYDFGGKAVTILVSSNTTSSWDMWYREDSSSFLDQAVFERNCYTEEMLNVCLEFVAIDNQNYVAHIQNLYMAGELEAGALDILSFPATYATHLNAIGCYKDLRASEYVDIDAPWWNASYNETAGRFGAQYTAFGDLNLASYDLATAIYFNSDMAKDCGFDLYEQVLDGTWTLDALYEYSKMCYADMNFDGITGLEDRIGVIGQRARIAPAFLRGCGVSLIEYNESSDAMEPELSDRAVELMYDLQNIWRSNSAYMTQQLNEAFTIMEQGNSLFLVDALNRNNGELANRLMESGISYGILPMPKENEEQANYITTLENGYTVTAIFIDSEMVGATLNTMGEYNHNKLMQDYRDNLYRFANSAEMTEMTSFILDNITWDYQTVYDATLGNATNLLWTQPFNNGAPLVSSFRANEMTVRMALERLETLLKVS